jgi:hypothetical protein
MMRGIWSKCCTYLHTYHNAELVYDPIDPVIDDRV